MNEMSVSSLQAPDPTVVWLFVPGSLTPPMSWNFQYSIRRKFVDTVEANRRYQKVPILLLDKIEEKGCNDKFGLVSFLFFSPCIKYLAKAKGNKLLAGVVLGGLSLYAYLYTYALVKKLTEKTERDREREKDKEIEEEEKTSC